ncbi:MAG TPA: CAP domain-containing protein [Actinomycetota bacterium]|nr:CAP domain-containing protein [Actinomycetota bacterium]
MKRVALILSILTGVLLMPTYAAQAALTSDGCWKRSTAERSFVRMTNTTRVERERRELPLDEDLSKAAYKHSVKMAKQGNLFHSTTADIDPLLSGRWVNMGENVGYGPDPETIQQAFMASKYHRQNILARKWRKMGVGVVKKDGLFWVTVWFQEGRDNVETTFRMRNC